MTTSQKVSALAKVSHGRSLRHASAVPRELIFDSLHANKGNIQKTAEDLDIRRVYLCNYIDRNHELVETCLSYRESLVDLAEENLRGDLERGSMKATFFALKTLGRTRGYVDRKEMEVVTPVEQSVDLTKLTDEQLVDLEKLMDVAHNTIDITPDGGENVGVSISIDDGGTNSHS